MDVLDVTKAAGQMGIRPRRLRDLARAGRIPAKRLGRSWAIDPEALVLARRRSPGRPLAAANAWGLLAMLSGERPDWLDPSVRSRLKRRLQDPERFVDALRWSEPRSEMRAWRILPADVVRLREEPGFVLSGLFAGFVGVDVLGRPDELDAYLDDAVLRRIRKRFKPIESPREPNVILRVPSQSWVLRQGPIAPPAVVAADLLPHPDPRVSRSARTFLERPAR